MLDSPNKIKCKNCRNRLVKLIEKPFFDWIVIVFIIISSIHLFLDSPLLDPKSKLAFALYILDFIITIIFMLESILKIIAYGIIANGEKSYFRNFWNLFDFIIVICSVNFILNNFSSFLF